MSLVMFLAFIFIVMILQGIFRQQARTNQLLEEANEPDYDDCDDSPSLEEIAAYRAEAKATKENSK